MTGRSESRAAHRVDMVSTFSSFAAGVAAFMYGLGVFKGWLSTEVVQLLVAAFVLPAASLAALTALRGVKASYRSSDLIFYLASLAAAFAVMENFSKDRRMCGPSRYRWRV